MHVKRVYSHLIYQAHLSTYGVDWDGPIPIDNDQPCINIPSVDSPISEENLSELVSSFDVENHSSDCHGVDLYLQVLDFIESCVFTNN